MMRQSSTTLMVIAICLIAMFTRSSIAQSNKVLGEVELVGVSNVEKTSGVWVDGQYVGYLKELKGSKKILLLPGEHEVSVRQDGYQDFTQKITVQPGEKQTIAVTMVKDSRFKMPSVFSEIGFSVTPDRAAVFVDGLFVGHVGEFNRISKSLLVAPGHRKITINLVGYQTFNTEVDLAPSQKFQIKTDLIKEGTAAPPVAQYLPADLCSSHVLFQAEGVQDVQRKFADEVVTAANSRLRQHAQCTTSPDILRSREPGAVQQAGREGSGIVRDLRPEFMLSPVIRDKVSRYCVQGPRPETVATAKVVSRFVAEGSIAPSYYAVLDYELTVTCCISSPIAGNAAPPVMRLASGLIKSS